MTQTSINVANFGQTVIPSTSSSTESISNPPSITVQNDSLKMKTSVVQKTSYSPYQKKPQEDSNEKRTPSVCRKVFVGGLSASTTQEDLTEYFVKFGNISECMLMFDKQTNRHRGFGFVTFDRDEPAEEVVKMHFHDIKTKVVECKFAVSKEAMQGVVPRVQRQPKVIPASLGYQYVIDPTTNNIVMIAPNVNGMGQIGYPQTQAAYAYPHTYLPSAIPGGNTGISFIDPKTVAYPQQFQIAAPTAQFQQQPPAIFTQDVASLMAVQRASQALNGQAALQQLQLPATSVISNGTNNLLTNAHLNLLGHGNGGVVPGAALQQTKFTAAATALQTDTNTLSSSSGAHPTDHQQQAIIQHIVSQQQQQTGQPSAAHASIQFPQQY